MSELSLAGDRCGGSAALMQNATSVSAIMQAMNEHDRPEEREGHAGLLVEEAAPEVRQPPLYSVVLLNDDYTPMEFVVEVLERFFRMDRESATRVMLEVHMKGKGICGVFTYEIAETKVAQVLGFSRDNQHPLMCTLEAA
jgi:ATP-dependent Clp protease adaptor protein ClpS